MRDGFSEDKMTIERLRGALRAEPFRPFTILVTDGRTYRVAHPDFLLVSPKAERTFVVYDEGSNDPEDYLVLDLLLVTGLEFGNGAGRRKRAG